MSFSLIPHGFYPCVEAINPEFLSKKGITLVLADLDNTLVAYKTLTPSPSIVQWKEHLNRNGIDLYIVSNSRKPTRVSQFSANLGVKFIGHSDKPSRRGFVHALKEMNRKPEETIMVGDQIFTDILGANRAGITPLLIAPIQLAGNPGRYIRYTIEFPFRNLGARRPFL